MDAQHEWITDLLRSKDREVLEVERDVAKVLEAQKAASVANR